MDGERADGGGCGGVASGVGGLASENFLELRGDETPAAVVLGFLLTPDELCVAVGFGDLREVDFVERIQLLDPDDGGVGDLVRGAVGVEVVVDLAGAKDEALGGLGGLNVVDDLWEASRGELRDLGDGGGETEEGLGRHDDERLAEVAFHLAAEGVEIVGRSGDVGHLDIVLGAELEKAFEAGGGVFGALSFVAVGEEENHAAHALPFRF